MGRKKEELIEKKPDAEEKLDADIPEKTEIIEKDQGAQTEEKELEEKKAAAVRGRYKIVCCNPIDEDFGGVSFHEGIAYTDDSYAASWFKNKEGYTVGKE